MNAVLIDYDSGNLHSAHKSLLKVAQPLGLEVEVSADAEKIRTASHLILPGVGAFADCYRGLATVEGLLPALHEAVLQRETPLLGICVGMQLLFERGLEHGVHQGLGWLAGEVRRIDAPRLKIPHMGWNALRLAKTPHPLMAGVQDGDQVYFVHSYHAADAAPQQILATCQYGEPVTAAVAKGHIMGTQFHPEKSQAIGLLILKNFLSMRHGN